MIKNVTKRASKAIYEVELAMDIVNEVWINDGNREDLYEALRILRNAEKQMALIIKQDLEVEES